MKQEQEAKESSALELAQMGADAAALVGDASLLNEVRDDSPRRPRSPVTSDELAMLEQQIRELQPPAAASAPSAVAVSRPVLELEPEPEPEQQAAPADDVQRQREVKALQAQEIAVLKEKMVQLRELQATHQEEKAQLQTLLQESEEALPELTATQRPRGGAEKVSQPTGDERTGRERASILHALQEAMRSRRTVYGHTLSDEAHVFAVLDRNNSGRLSREEIANAFKRLGLGLSARQVDALCEYMVADDNGEIDYMELLNFVERNEMSYELDPNSQSPRLISSSATAGVVVSSTAEPATPAQLQQLPVDGSSDGGGGSGEEQPPPLPSARVHVSVASVHSATTHIIAKNSTPAGTAGAPMTEEDRRIAEARDALTPAAVLAVADALSLDLVTGSAEAATAEQAGTRALANLRYMEIGRAYAQAVLPKFGGAQQVLRVAPRTPPRTRMGFDRAVVASASSTAAGNSSTGVNDRSSSSTSSRQRRRPTTPPRSAAGGASGLPRAAARRKRLATATSPARSNVAAPRRHTPAAKGGGGGGSSDDWVERLSQTPASSSRRRGADPASSPARQRVDQQGQGMVAVDNAPRVPQNRRSDWLHSGDSTLHNSGATVRCLTQPNLTAPPCFVQYTIDRCMPSRVQRGGCWRCVDLLCVVCSFACNGCGVRVRAYCTGAAAAGANACPRPTLQAGFTEPRRTPNQPSRRAATETLTCPCRKPRDLPSVAAGARSEPAARRSRRCSCSGGGQQERRSLGETSPPALRWEVRWPAVNLRSV